MNMQMPALLNRVKNKFSDFCFLSYGSLDLKFLATHLNFQVCQRPEKIFQKWSNLQEREQWAETNEKSIYQFLVFQLRVISSTKFI